MKKGSLNLSVNAIVVFVLAFAMLSVGLYFTNILRTKLGEDVVGIMDITELKSPPTSENPITVSSTVVFKKGKSLQMDIGFYNKENTEATDAKMGISDCIDDTGTAATTLPTVSSHTVTVDSTQGVGYKLIVTEPTLTMGTGTYICTLNVFNAGTPTQIYESKQFFFNVVS